MVRFLKYIFWLAVAGGIVYGGYYAYNNWWNGEIAGNISNGAGVIGQTVSNKATDYAKSIASTTGQSVASFIKSNIGDFISNVGEQIQSAGVNLSGSTSSVPVSTAILPPIQSVSSLPLGNVPAPTSSAFDMPPPPATIVVNAGELLSFSVNSGQIYKVDWGDGTKSQGATEADAITIVHHSWSALGDYVVNVNVGNSVTNNTYSFPVRVYQ